MWLAGVVAAACGDAVDDFDLPLFSFFFETGVNSTLTKIGLEHLPNTKG